MQPWRTTDSLCALVGLGLTAWGLARAIRERDTDGVLAIVTLTALAGGVVLLMTL